ncbi:TPA: LOW QUALITY PROTEIN: hypothetical protein N0F65_008693, partial [Lagenidium giganteum]
NQVVRFKVMSPTTPSTNEILTDEIYFLWEYNARMSLARKDLGAHHASQARRETAEWKVADMKALAILSKLLSPVYQTMVREATTALEAWTMLRAFFVNQNIHSRVKLRKELHEFTMDNGGNLMEHFLRFDDLCLRLATVGERVDDRERLVLLLGIWHDGEDLREAKELLKREYDELLQHEKEESAFKASGGRRGGGHARLRNKSMSPSRQNNDKRVDYLKVDHRHGGKSGSRFTGKRFACGQEGHKQSQSQQNVFSATAENSAAWVLDSGASSHMTYKASDLVELRNLKSKLTMSIANGRRVEVEGVDAVRLKTLTGVCCNGALIESKSATSLLEAKENFTREYEIFHMRDKKENAYKSKLRERRGRGKRQNGGGRDKGQHQGQGQQQHQGQGQQQQRTGKKSFEGQCYECKQHGHKKADCPRLKGNRSGHEDSFLANDTSWDSGGWLLDSGASCHMTHDRDDFLEYRPLKSKLDITVANGQRVSANGIEKVKLQQQDCSSIVMSDVPYVPKLDRKLASISTLTAKGAMSAPLSGCQASMVASHLKLVCWRRDDLDHVINGIPNTARPETTPFEVIAGSKPLLDLLRAFGSRGFEQKAHRCTFLGYVESSKAYRVWAEEDQRIVIT